MWHGGAAFGNGSMKAGLAMQQELQPLLKCITRLSMQAYRLAGCTSGNTGTYQGMQHKPEGCMPNEIARQVYEHPQQ